MQAEATGGAVETRSPAAYAAVQDYLFGLKARGLKFGIDRMRLLADALGHPERAAPCVHVAGTNGKGSVSAMLDAMFRAGGWRTGLYTSPHLVRLGERVQVNRTLLTESEITAWTGELRPVAAAVAEAGGEDDHASFFEFMTAMAFLQFARSRCDLNLIEVGLGGRLDATNIVDPVVSVITSIGLDHCDMLGDTFEEIAAEKAGIIKPGRPVVVGRMPAAAEKVIRNIARERGAPLLSVAEEFGGDLGRYPQTNLEGDYQRWNAATAMLAAGLFPSGWRMTNDVLSRGLQAVDWPGRWQRVTVGGRLVILDTSHNPEGAQVLDSNLAHLAAEKGGAPVVVTGALGSRRAGPLLEVVCRHAREVRLVVPNQARACSHGELEALIPPGFSGRVFRSTVEELFPSPDVCAVSGDDTVVVTGSVYLIGEVLARLEPQRGPGEGRLQDF
jgi:dihydrofolate synthase/folylpolyglutamate synthase